MGGNEETLVAWIRQHDIDMATGRGRPQRRAGRGGCAVRGGGYRAPFRAGRRHEKSRGPRGGECRPRRPAGAERPGGLDCEGDVREAY